MRPIDADALYEELNERHYPFAMDADLSFADDQFRRGISFSMDCVKEAPTIDAVPVPCYVGDEIWYVPDWHKEPFKAVCHCISIDKGGVRVHLYDMCGDNATYPARCVFKSKEDAERYITENRGKNE